MQLSLKGVSALFLTAFMFGTWGVLSRLLGQHFDIFFQFWTRYLFLSSFLLLFLLIKKEWKPIDTKTLPWFGLRVILGFLSILTFYISFNAISIGTAYFAIYAGTVVGGFILGIFFFKEKLTFVKSISFLLSLLGIYIIYFVNFNPSQFLYLLLAVSSGLIYAAWYSFSKKISGSYSVAQISFIDYATGLLFSLILSILLHETWIIPTLTFPWLILLVFAITSLATSILILYGFRHVEVQLGTIILLTEILFGIALGYFVFHEVLTPTILLGGSFVITATVLPLLSKQNKQKST